MRIYIRVYALSSEFHHINGLGSKGEDRRLRSAQLMMMIIHFGKTRYSAITDTSTNTSTASARLHSERGSKTLKRQAITVSMPVLECPE